MTKAMDWGLNGGVLGIIMTILTTLVSILSILAPFFASEEDPEEEGSTEGESAT